MFLWFFLVGYTLPKVVTLDTATIGSDYTDPTATPLTFPFDLVSTSTFSYIMISPDSTVEPTELFYISLGSFTPGTYAELGTLRKETTIRIRDDGKYVSRNMSKGRWQLIIHSYHFIYNLMIYVLLCLKLITI